MLFLPKHVQERLAAITNAKLEEAIRLGPAQLLPALHHERDIVEIGELTCEKLGRWTLTASAYLYQVHDGPVLLCAQGNAWHPWMLIPSRISWDIGVRVAADGTCQPLTESERRLIPW